MHKNAIKIVWGGLGSQKLCAFYHKCGAFLVGKNCAPFCALFGQKMCAFEFKIIKNSDETAVDKQQSNKNGRILRKIDTKVSFKSRGPQIV